MSKSHIINLNIHNQTGGTLTFVHAYFQTGGLADNNQWADSIPPGGVSIVQCCEAYLSPVGCSGWVEYSLNNAPIYFCFSNPSVGKNGIAIGADTTAWDHMQAQYLPIGRGVQLSDGTWVVANLLSTEGSTNNASWEIRICDTTTIIPANIELQNVQGIWENFPVSGTRAYYQCDTEPTPPLGLAKSHFKGISSFGDRLLFTHTNLLSLQSNGKLLIADRIAPGANQGMVDAMYETQHPGWPHPCSSQACGSYMAMGIQADESGPGSKVSQIQILDIRMTQAYQNPTVIGTIDIPDDGVNGVGMTKEAGPDGKYLVAGINGNTLTVYRSLNSSLITNGVPTATFERVFQQNIEDSGPGLAMVTQQGDGAIYFFALNADAGQPSYMNLYKLDLNGQPQVCTQICVKQMQMPGMSETVSLLKYYVLALPQPWGLIAAGILKELGEVQLDSSFRYGKGMKIVSPDTIEVYASDRNVWPLSQFPLVGTSKDFSLVTWTNEGAPRQVGLPIQASNVWAGSASNVGMILTEPVSTASVLTTFNVMLSSQGGGVSGTPVALVLDRTVDGAGNTTFTVSQTSAVVGLDPTVYTTQNLALDTPLTIKPGQVVGFVNSGPQNFLVNWIDGPAHHVVWPDITPVPGFAVTLPNGNDGTPVVSCGWNFTAAPLS